MMRSYAGVVEGAMTSAEARAKQVGTALARDTAGQAQAALQQIERLRDEAQAHTQRAVSDLKSSFETVITQIGRQLEQMRGQFDNTSRGMRETAQKTASDLDSLRQEMQKRMEGLPEQTAKATAAIRKALVGAASRDRGDHHAGAVAAGDAAAGPCPGPVPQQAPAQPHPQPFQPPRRANSISARCRISMPEAGRWVPRTAISVRSQAGSPASSRAPPIRHAALLRLRRFPAEPTAPAPRSARAGLRRGGGAASSR